ncbi:MAG: biotin/lipoyl-binding protein [Caldilineaceae bacterium]
MKKLTYGLAIGAVVLGVAGYLGVNTFAQSTIDNAASTEQAAPVAISESAAIIVDAAVVPVREADLSMATSGIVKTVLVEEGDYVLAGQPLVHLNDERLQAALAQAQANLTNAQANLAELLAPPQAAEIAKYEANITSAQTALQDILEGAGSAEIAAKEADLANAEAEMRQAQSDYDEVSWRSDIAMLDEALALEKATNNYNAAKAALDDLLAAADAGDIASANANIVSAQADLDLLLAGSEKEPIAAARATMAANEASVRDAQAALNEATLVAPFAGVVAAVNVDVGEQVATGAAVVQLADTSQWRIETEDLTELDVVNVARGDAAEIRFDAIDDAILTGVIKNIKPLGENNQGDITYTVLIELNEQDERLRWNMSAEANITRDEAGRVATSQPTQANVTTNSVETSTGPVLTVGDLRANTGDAETSSAIGANGLTAPNATVSVNGSRLNVRQEPNVSAAIMNSLHDGSRIQVLSQNADGSWLQVALGNDETGWVSADYILLDAPHSNLAVDEIDQGM